MKIKLGLRMVQNKRPVLPCNILMFCVFWGSLSFSLVNLSCFCNDVCGLILGAASASCFVISLIRSAFFSLVVTFLMWFPTSKLCFRPASYQEAGNVCNREIPFYSLSVFVCGFQIQKQTQIVFAGQVFMSWHDKSDDSRVCVPLFCWVCVFPVWFCLSQ